MRASAEPSAALPGPHPYHAAGLARRLLLAVVLFSSAVTAVITAIDLYGSYRRDLGSIAQAFDYVDQHFTPALARSVWLLDERQVQSELAALVHLPLLAHVAVEVDGTLRWQAGTRPQRPEPQRRFALRFTEQGSTLQVGTLVIAADGDLVLAHMWTRLAAVLAGNAVKTLLVAAFLMLAFHLMVTRHLLRITDFVRAVRPGGGPAEDGTHASTNTETLALRRSTRGPWRPDVLDEQVAAINTMLAALREGHAALAASHAEVARINASLEQRIAERTQALERALAEAERASNAKSEFLSRVSHELRTPLNAVLGFGQMLAFDLRDAGAQRKVEHILKAGQHLLALIDDLLDMARIEAGQVPMRIEPVALAPLVDDALMLLRPAAAERGVQLAAPELPAGCHVLADRTRLKQVLLNLLSNAVKYNRANGRVQVRAAPADGAAPGGTGALLLHISDEGRGLSAAETARLFMPFERLDADARGVPGIGIGLAHSKRLADLMNIPIGVDSQPGSGSTFWLRLRQATAPSPVDSPAAGAQHASG